VPLVRSSHAHEVPLMPRTLAEAAQRRTDGVEVALAPHREQVTGAEPANVRVLPGMAVRLRLDSAVERRLAELPEADRGDVQVGRGRYVVADGHVDAVALERHVLAEVPPDVHQMPRHPGIVFLASGRNFLPKRRTATEHE